MQFSNTSSWQSSQFWTPLHKLKMLSEQSVWRTDPEKIIQNRTFAFCKNIEYMEMYFKNFILWMNKYLLNWNAAVWAMETTLRENHSELNSWSLRWRHAGRRGNNHDLDKYEVNFIFKVSTIQESWKVHAHVHQLRCPSCFLRRIHSFSQASTKRCRHQCPNRASRLPHSSSRIGTRARSQCYTCKYHSSLAFHSPVPHVHVIYVMQLTYMYLTQGKDTHPQRFGHHSMSTNKDRTQWISNLCR